MAKSIYIHLPFCKTKCPYCDFASGTYNELQGRYLQALFREIELRSQLFNKTNKVKIETIFFGGGTPSIHEPEYIEAILNKLKDYYVFEPNIEITLETNPGTVSKEKLEAFMKTGINRLSIGVQTFDDELLQKLGRGHSLQDSLDVITWTKDLPFNSWSIDLIYGLPKQSLYSWQKTLEQCFELDPPHISAYALSIEQGTPYGDTFKDSTHQDLPQEDLLAEMYALAKNLLAQTRYEVSNWAYPGHECRHNLTYWRAHEYFAFGLGAHGYVHSVRYANTKDINKYIQEFEHCISVAEAYDFCVEVNNIAEDEKLEEKIMLQLRLNEGLKLEPELLAKIDLDKLEFLSSKGFIQKKLIAGSNNIKINEDKLFLANKIIGELIN